MIPINQILDLAADRVADGWCQGYWRLYSMSTFRAGEFVSFTFDMDEGDSPCAWCADEAIAIECEYSAILPDERHARLLGTALDFVKSCVGMSVREYNDAEGRRVYEVEKMLRDCAVAWREQQ